MYEEEPLWREGEWGFLQFTLHLPMEAGGLLKKVNEDYFRDHVAQVVYEAMTGMVEGGIRVSYSALRKRLRGDGHAGEVPEEFFQPVMRGPSLPGRAEELARMLGESLERRRKAESVPERLRPVWTCGDRALETMEAASSCLRGFTWLWPGWLARGVVTLAASKSGDGKSALALELARRVASGSSLCGSSLCRGGPMCPPFSLSSSADAKTKEEEKQQEGPHMGGPLQEEEEERVIYVETEASEAVLRDRVKRWSVPEERLLVFTSRCSGGAMADVCLSDPAQLDALHEAAMETHPALVIVDSLSGAHLRDENSSRMRGIMMSLARLARNASCAVLVLHHLHKRPARDGRPAALDCLRGSTAIAQFARCVWTIDRPDPTGPRRRLSQVKNNLACCPDALGFEVREDGVVFGPPPPQERVRATVVQRASQWLSEVLKEGTLPGPELFRQAGECGFSKKSIYRAGEELGAVKSRNGETGHWIWRIPDSGAVPGTA